MLDDEVNTLAYIHKDCSKECDKNKNKNKDNKNDNENEKDNNENENANDKNEHENGNANDNKVVYIIRLSGQFLILLFFYERNSKHLKHKQKHLK